MHTRLDSYKDCVWEETSWSGVLKPLCWGLEANMLVFCTIELYRNFIPYFGHHVQCPSKLSEYWLSFIVPLIRYVSQWVQKIQWQENMYREWEKAKGLSLSPCCSFFFYLTCTEEVACTLFSFYITPALSTSKGLHNSCDMKGEGRIGY